MTLPSPNLDDRKFQDFVDEAKRLIPTYAPEWTNHNVSDPGVALIELFAWMSELVLFRINQLPDRLYTKFLDLVGIEPFASSASRAMLTFWLSAKATVPVVVPQGTLVGTMARQGSQPILFGTLEELVISQPVLVAAGTTTAAEPDRLVDILDALRYEGDTTAVFASQPDPVVGDAIYLGFEHSLAGNVIQLVVDAAPEGIGVDPRRPPLVWEISSDEGWLPTIVQEDSTGGLNRNGVIKLLLPLAHATAAVGDARHYWLRGVLAHAADDQPTYRSTPRLRTLSAASLGGSVAAEHARAAGAEVLGKSDGSPDQRLAVRNVPVLPRMPGETVEVTADGIVTRWVEVDDFAQSAKDDLHFCWDAATGEIRFGPRIRYPDGSVVQHGKVPPSGAEIAVTGYRHGGGSTGNVGAGTLTALQRSIPYIGSVTNLREATGGVDPETVENAKLRGPMTLRTGQRAVTAGDYERLTSEASPAVARARCLPPNRPAGPVRVLVVPTVDKPADKLLLDDFVLSDELVTTIADHLEERRVLGTTVEIGTPYYNGVTVAALVQAKPGRPSAQVKQRAIDALYRYVNPVIGGPDGRGWPFDLPLNAATVFQLLADVDGVERVDEVVFFEYDLRRGERVGTGQEIVRPDPHTLFMSAAHQVVVR